MASDLTKSAEFIERDFDAQPYSEHEARVAKYLCEEVFRGQIGAGADPIGFLIAHHRTLLQLRRTTLEKRTKKK